MGEARWQGRKDPSGCWEHSRCSDGNVNPSRRKQLHLCSSQADVG